MALVTRELTPSDWPIVERLFGERGACGGCWCMWWRVEKGGKTWDAMKGARAKAEMHRRVKAGRALAVLAFDGGEPVGWCAFGPRSEFPRLERSAAYRVDDAESVWSIPCFFVAAGHRGKGVATALLRAAITALRRRRARVAEGYPVVAHGKRMPAAFAWTGPLALFEKAGFRVHRRTRPRRPLVRRTLRR